MRKEISSSTTNHDSPAPPASHCHDESAKPPLLLDAKRGKPNALAWLRVKPSMLLKDRRDNSRQPATPGVRASVEYSEARRSNAVIPAAVISEMAAARCASACLSQRLGNGSFFGATSSF